MRAEHSLTSKATAAALALLASAALAVSCTGKVTGGVSPPGSSGGAGPTGSSGGSGPGPTTGSGGSGPGPGTTTGSGGASLPPGTTPDGGVVAPTPESAGPMMMRRLTNREYSNIIAELLVDTSAPGSEFPLDGPTATGFEAPNSVADLNVQYYMQTADVLAERALANGKLTIPCTNPAASAEVTCAGNFITTFGRRAYRRPVTAAEKTDLTAVFSKARTLGFAFTSAIAQTVKAMLQSPNFLYHWELGPTKPTLEAATGLANLTQHQIASRLSTVLWESMPDETLLTAADMGQLGTVDQVKAQAQRMLMDARASNALFNFHAQWLLQVNGHVTDLHELTKSSTQFTEAAKQALAGEFTQFLSSVYTGDGTLTTLLTAPYAYVNAALAPIYKVTAPGTAFTKVALPATERAGILTQTAFLAANADPSASNPVRRGLAVYMNVLCGTILPPPANVPDLGPAMPSTTTRQRFAAHSTMSCAQGCHNSFDPPGFAFENYDAVGGYRTTEAGQAVDASGSFKTPGGATIAFQNAVDLMTKLADSDEVKWCVDRQWFRYMLGRADTAAEKGSMELAYTNGRAATGYSLRDMLLTMVSSKSFRFRAPSPGEAL